MASHFSPGQMQMVGHCQLGVVLGIQVSGVGGGHRGYKPGGLERRKPEGTGSVVTDLAPGFPGVGQTPGSFEAS